MTARIDEQPDAETLAEARRLYDLGLEVVPLKPREKGIGSVGKYKGKRYAFGFIRRRLSYSRDAGIGIRMGRDLVAIDIDPRAGGHNTWREIIRDKDLPPTAHQSSGGGGDHYVYRIPPGIDHEMLKAELGPGVEIKKWSQHIVVAPTVLRKGRPYEWDQHPCEGIAFPPPYLLARMLKTAPGPGPKPQSAASPRASGRAARGSDVASWAAWAIERHPITKPKTRHAVRMKLVPALLGMGLDRETTLTVVTRWWAHFFAAGLCETDPSGGAAGRDILPYIDTIMNDVGFGLAGSGEAHDERKAEITLTPETYTAIGETPGPNERQGEPERPGEMGALERVTSLRVSRGSRRKDDRLCQTPEEAAFVEALLVHAHHQARVDRAPVLRMTWDQLRTIVAARHPGIARWENVEFGRFAEKFIDRDDLHKPARRRSLLRRTYTGHNATAGRNARPSEYEITGLAALLALGSVRLAEKQLRADSAHCPSPIRDCAAVDARAERVQRVADVMDQIRANREAKRGKALGTSTAPRPRMTTAQHEKHKRFAKEAQRTCSPRDLDKCAAQLEAILSVDRVAETLAACWEHGQGQLDPQLKPVASALRSAGINPYKVSGYRVVDLAPVASSR